MFFELNDVRQAFMMYDKPEMEFDNIGWSLTKGNVYKYSGNE